MTSKKRKYSWIILLRVLYLFITLLALVYFILSQQWLYAIISCLFVVWSLTYFFRFIKRANDEMEQFIEAVHFRDFTHHYALQKSPADLRTLRNGFNEINDTFKMIALEKETQHHNLHQILELIETGILCFAVDSGETLWLNKALKDMLDVPHLKNINRMERTSRDILHAIRSLHHGDSQIVSFKKNAQYLKILLNVTAFQTNGILYKLIAFQNVSEALDETESKAWQKLLSVMTHEIMNSVAPIASLADTLKTRLKQQQESKTWMEDLELGIATIQRRSEGLIRFADIYRNLNKISRLEKMTFSVKDLFENIDQLMGPTLQQKGIELEVVLHGSNLILEADRNLMEQVLINLILNAIEALKGQRDPQIILSGGEEDGRPFLSVKDNGKGIPAEIMDRIFIPFFSTRKEGSGIGLSLCKQIMLMHGGSINVYSSPEKFTLFTLAFRD